MSDELQRAVSEARRKKLAAKAGMLNAELADLYKNNPKAAARIGAIWMQLELIGVGWDD
jgi:hypothetical protein